MATEPDVDLFPTLTLVVVGVTLLLLGATLVVEGISEIDARTEK